MTKEAREKLKNLYDSETERARAIIDVFEHQFGEAFVDNSLPTFDDFLQKLSTMSLASLGIYRTADTNEYGSYTIDEKDFNDNVDKPFTESITDPGIIDYLSPDLKEWIEIMIRRNNTFEPDSAVFYITIKFPEVTVTNEYDKSVVIYDLFVRIPVTLSGITTGKFKMTRTTYTVDQWVSGYVHSHLPSRSTGFSTPCTGQGPINNTIGTLRRRYDINVWGLYSFEIAKYVVTESIAGVPYIRLESIGSDGSSGVINTDSFPYRGTKGYYAHYSSIKLEEFVQSFLKAVHIKFTYRNGNFTIGENLLDIWVRMSNFFIEWHNSNLREGKLRMSRERLLTSGVISTYIISNGKVYNERTSSKLEQIQSDEGKDMFMFKGEMQKLHFVDNTPDIRNRTLLVSQKLLYYALTKALTIINYRYGREKTRGEGTSANPRTLYL